MVKFLCRKMQGEGYRDTLSGGEIEHEVSVRKAPRSSDRNQNKIGLCQVLKLRIRETGREYTYEKWFSSSFISRHNCISFYAIFSFVLFLFLFFFYLFHGRVQSSPASLPLGFTGLYLDQLMTHGSFSLHVFLLFLKKQTES